VQRCLGLPAPYHAHPELELTGRPRLLVELLLVSPETDPSIVDASDAVLIHGEGDRRARCARNEAAIDQDF
jgi:hypothetical protein